MRVAPDVDADGWRIVHITLNDGVGRKGGIMDVALVSVGVDHDVNFGRGIAMDHIVRDAIQGISRSVVLPEVGVKAIIADEADDGR